MQTLLITNPKGGVGRTTLCLMTALRALQRNLRVLLIDLDAHGHLSGCLPPTQASTQTSTASQLFGKSHQIVPEVLENGLAIVRSDEAMLEDSIQQNPSLSKSITLEDFDRNLRSVSESFDLCIIDTGSSCADSGITSRAMFSADAWASPFTIYPGSVRDFDRLIEWNSLVSSERGNPAKFLGFIPTRYPADGRRLLQFLGAVDTSVIKINPHGLPSRSSVSPSVALCRPVWENVDQDDEDHKLAATEWLTTVDHLLSETLPALR